MDQPDDIGHIVRKNGHYMDLSELRSFLSVARAGSFSAAAEQTGVAKSTLSSRVQSLEASLNLRLLERTTRRLRLTPEGEVLVQRAAPLIAEADELERSLRDRNAEPSGRLRVSAPVFGQARMGQTAAAYVQRWPNASIEVDFSDRTVDLLEEDFDCAIRIGPLPDSGLIARAFARSRTVLVASPEVTEGLRPFDSPEALAGAPTISFAPSGVAVDWILENGAERLRFRPESRVTLGSLEAACAASVAGGGVALVPEVVAAEALESGLLTRLMPEWQGPASALNLVYPAHRHASPRLRAFFDVLLERGL